MTTHQGSRMVSETRKTVAGAGALPKELAHAYRLLVLLGCLAWACSASGITVTINTDAARAVLEALQNPTLSHEASMQIGGLQGSQGIIRKLNEFKIPVTTQSFAHALYASAHGLKVMDSTEQSFYFDGLKPKIGTLLSLLDRIEASPLLFEGAIERRIELFTPPGSDIHLQGYIVAGGDGGGYAFGDTDFYLNIGFGGEFAVAKSSTTHELYHAVQGAFAKRREDSAAGYETTQSYPQKSCVNAAQLFQNVYEEGSATYVEDISLLSGAKTEGGMRMRDDMADGLKHVQTSAELLEMSVISLSAADAMPYDEVYDVGFLGHGILYDIGYVMAKAIVDNDGPQGLAVYLKEPAYRFVVRYAQLPKYGKDNDHPELGPHTLAAARQIANGCKTVAENLPPVTRP